MNLGNLLSASAERNPRKTAIVLEDQNISYEQLERSTTSLARWFLRQGCKPGGPHRSSLHHARALSIIEFQMPLDFRMSSTVSRIAPCPASAFVV
jgi:non-ribosomal peptide synthetase component E (peptide arylation enzyme)